MISVTSPVGAALMTLTVSGKVSGREYAQICDLLGQALTQNESVSLLCALESFRGIGLSVMWRAAVIASQNAIKLRRVAVVGDPARYRFARVLVRGFHAETRYFSPTHRAQATRWLSASNPAETDSGSGFAGDAGYRQAKSERDRRRPKLQKRNRP